MRMAVCVIVGSKRPVIRGKRMNSIVSVMKDVFVFNSVANA